MAFLAPIGTFLTTFDVAITAAQTAAVAGLVDVMQGPLAYMAVIYFVIMGWRVASGDLARLNGFTFDIVKIGLIFYLSTNLSSFNYWVIGVFEHGFPDAISQAVAGGGDAQSGTDAGVATSIDKIWSQLWGQAATIWQRAGMLDVSSRLVAASMAVFGGIGLLLDAGVYLIARLLFAIVVVLGPVAIACAMFNSTRPIFERWIGKGVALIVLQVAAIITMEIVFVGSQSFITVPGDATADLPTQIQNMVSTVIWILMGAFAIYSLPALAYSIGTGVAVSMAPIAMAAIAAASAGTSSGQVAAARLGSGPSEPSGGFPDFNLSLDRAGIAASSGGDTGGSSGLLEASLPRLPPPPFLLQ